MKKVLKKIKQNKKIILDQRIISYFLLLITIFKIIINFFIQKNMKKAL